MATLAHDLRYALRTFARTPGFTLIAIATLALGIGANTAIFSLVNTVLLKPLSYAQSDRLLWVGATNQGRDMPAVSPPDFADFRSGARSFDRLAAFGLLPWPANLVGGAEPLQLRGTLASGGFFTTFGLGMHFGRDLTEADEQSENPLAAVLSYSAWQQHFGSDPSVVGRPARLDGHPVTVVGVAPAGFAYPGGIEVWISMPMKARGMQQRVAHFLGVVGRMKPGVHADEASAEIGLIALRLAEQHASNKYWGARARPLQDQLTRGVRTPLLVLLGAVGLVLLIACANVANLCLARATGRRREVAIRSALGAGRGRIAAQMLVESAVLAAAGASVGLLLGWWSLDAFRAFAPPDLPRVQELALDLRVVAFTVACTALTALLFGAAPALHATRLALSDALRDARAAAGSPGNRLRGAFVAAEIAVSLVLLLGAGLVVRSLMNLSAVNPGFHPENRWAARLSVPDGKYPDPATRRQFFRTLLEHIEQLPGDARSATISQLPLTDQHNDNVFWVQGRAEGSPLQMGGATIRQISPGYFDVMGVPILRGRAFTSRDDERAAQAIIVNDQLAREYFPGEEAVGRHLKIGGSDRPWEIVGVAGGVRHFGLQADPPSEMYVPVLQQPFPEANIVVHGGASPADFSGALREAVRAVDPEQPISQLQPLSGVVSLSIAAPRFRAFLFGLFGALALVLAAVGIYGVVSWMVTERTREIGVRMALGAQRSDVIGMVLRQGMGYAAIGVVVGIAAGLAVARVLASLLFGVTPTDPLTFALAVAFLAAVALAACAVPARRATRVDPMIALRAE